MSEYTGTQKTQRTSSLQGGNEETRAERESESEREKEKRREERERESKRGSREK